jgi:hypothetical protein
MEQDEVIRRLKGMSRQSVPPVPEFSEPTITMAAAPVARTSRFALAPVAAVVGVLALAVGVMAVPKGGPLRQVVANHTDDADQALHDAEDEAQDALDDAETQACDQLSDPSADAQVEAGDGDGSDISAGASATAEEDVCEEDAPLVGGNDEAATDDDADAGEPKSNPREGRPEKTNDPHADDPCKGPPPHSNKPGTGDPERDKAQRDAEREAWMKYHRENCRGEGQGQGQGEGQGRPEDKPEPEDRRPEDAGEGAGEGRGHEKAKGNGHGPNDERHADRRAENDDDGSGDD